MEGEEHQQLEVVASTLSETQEAEEQE